MTLAVCLLTADRHSLTADTVKTFVEHNDTDGMILLHADDASQTHWNFEIAKAGEFETVYANRTGVRQGQIPALFAMWNMAAGRGATHILHLENDQEFVGPIPKRRDAQTIRLYGERKMRGDSPRAFAGPHIMGTKERIVWNNDGHDWQRGVAHWGGQASITETEVLLYGIHGAQRIKDISMSLQRLDTLRPRENITWHIDEAGTPDHWLKGKPGKRT